MTRIIKKYFLIILILVLIFAAAFGALYAYSTYVNSKEYIINLGIDDDDYRFTYEVSKSWEEVSINYHYGMQCDFEVENYTNNVMKDWVVTIELNEKCQIDSNWNGDFTLTDDDTITMIPLDYNDTVDAGEIQPFGFILKGPQKSCIKTAQINYHIHKDLEDFALFYILTLLGIICLCFCIISISYELKNERLNKSREEAVKIINQSYITFANMIDAKDKYTKGHSQRVAYYSREIARRMGFEDDKQNNIFYVALLHDIGKIGVQDAILKKTAKLTYDEFNEIKEHVSMGGDILKNFTAIDGIEDGARYHHERYDGTGYMKGLKGKEIPQIARIICIADAFDAMSSARCYRENPLSTERIRDELISHSGTQFDPDIIPIMIDMIDEGTVPIELSDNELEKEFSIIRAVKLT